MTPLGKDGGGRKSGPDDSRWKGLRGGRKTVSRYRGRGCGVSHPLGMGKMKARERVRHMKAQGGSFKPVLDTPVVGPRAGVRPRVTDGGGEGTKAKELQMGILRRSSHHSGSQH